MAVDSATKRLSMLDWGEELSPVPLPTGAFNTKAERQHLLGLYSGIEATSGSATPLTTTDQTPIFWGRIR